MSIPMPTPAAQIKLWNSRIARVLRFAVGVLLVIVGLVEMYSAQLALITGARVSAPEIRLLLVTSVVDWAIAYVMLRGLFRRVR